ncbi:wiskott-Aldrich syndrome protein homolog 1-like [Mesocricetus auratus]|uniref:Wiskott-Aldrich syndrome protein homolog 1-like n=1 Tax=Mesocricetus auratus TaxID=10036 RepID=A0A3Q0CMT6_MESAU|nr:wiskott-Aldrich syndrome protein homolog 1-like [Mesocricetus auratus]
MLPRHPFPVRSRPFGLSHCAQDFPPLRAELSSQDQAGAGLRPGRPAPPPPPPHCRKCLPAGTSLTSQDSDVNGRVPARARLGGGGRVKQQRPSRGRRDIPARAARRHLGSRLLTARAALSNSLQSRPPTPGPAPGPPTPGPSAPPYAAQPLSAVLMRRRSLPRALPSKVPWAAVGAGPAHARTRSHSPRRPRRPRS